MKLLTAESGSALALADCYLHGFRKLGVDVATYRVTSGPSSLPGRILARLFRLVGLSRNGQRLLRAVREHSPDVVLIFKGMEFSPGLLAKIRRQGIRLVNYNADHPLEYFSAGSGNANVRNGIAHYDLYCTYSDHIAALLAEAEPETRVAVIPFGHSVGAPFFDSLTNEAEIGRGCFLGNPDAERARAIQFLADHGIPMSVYGFGWPQYLATGSNVEVHAGVLGEAMLRTLRRYRFQLNIFRPHNVHSHNMRTFEVPAVGGIMLAPDSAEHRRFFNDGRDAFLFGSDEEMLAKAREIMLMPPQDADRIRSAARARTEALQAHYDDRARTLIDHIENLLRP